MDPLTLFALANGAVSAVKAGCKLYKDIKGAAGEVKDILKDLDEQFAKLHPPEKPATVAQKNAYIQEKNRVIELNKRDGETTGIYTEIGEHLGAYYDNYHKCMAIFEEEERRSKNEIYTGDASLGKRALQRVLMRKQLQQMEVELREIMVYQSPPELGALHTEVEEMMSIMGRQQKNLIIQQMKRHEIEERKRKQKLHQLQINIIIGIGSLLVCCGVGLTLSYVVEDRIKKYPQYGTDWIPKNQSQRQREAQKQIYVGR
jgi:hypothetical protein